ncbi:hypothetical protein BDK51DRAFT_29512, partial [Blyttiomyces helicus]
MFSAAYGGYQRGGSKDIRGLLYDRSVQTVDVNPVGLDYEQLGTRLCEPWGPDRESVEGTAHMRGGAGVATSTMCGRAAVWLAWRGPGSSYSLAGYGAVGSTNDGVVRADLQAEQGGKFDIHQRLIAVDTGSGSLDGWGPPLLEAVTALDGVLEGYLDNQSCAGCQSGAVGLENQGFRGSRKGKQALGNGLNLINGSHVHTAGVAMWTGMAATFTSGWQG